MQILIQEGKTRVKFTRSEVGKLKAAATLLSALDRQVHDDDVSPIREHLDAVLGRINQRYEYTEPTAEAGK